MALEFAIAHYRQPPAQAGGPALVLVQTKEECESEDGHIWDKVLFGLWDNNFKQLTMGGIGKAAVTWATYSTTWNL